jgi:hypothetical protein
MRSPATWWFAACLALATSTAFAQSQPNRCGLLCAIGNLFGPSQSPEALAAADDAQCRGYGFKPQTEGYANCRLKLTELRANAQAAAQSRQQAAPPAVGGWQSGTVYDPSECIGPVIMGRCQGTIVPNKAYHPTCYGVWLNGTCTGPMF